MARQSGPTPFQQHRYPGLLPSYGRYQLARIYRWLPDFRDIRPSITSQPTDVTVTLGLSNTERRGECRHRVRCELPVVQRQRPSGRATSSSLHFNAVAAADAYAYTVKVTDWAGTVIAPATLAYTSGSAGGVTYMATTTFDAGTPCGH